MSIGLLTVRVDAAAIRRQRYDRIQANYLAGLYLASLSFWA